MLASPASSSLLKQFLVFLSAGDADSLSLLSMLEVLLTQFLRLLTSAIKRKRPHRLHIGYGTFLGTSYSDAVMPRLLWSQSWKNTWLLRFANTNHIYLFTSFRSPGGSLANSCPALKRFLITDKNEEIISESVILSCIFLLVDIKNVKSGLLALMKDLSMKSLNSARRLTDI